MKKLNNLSILSQSEVVDLLTDFVLKNGKSYSKFQTTLIRPGIIGEYIETHVESGLETKTTVKENQFVVQALTKAREQYVITAEKFHGRYELSNSPLPQGFEDTEFKVYVPKGKITAIKAREVMEGDEVFFMASWGETMRLQPEDMIAVPTGLPPEIYRIAWAEFLQTYKETV